jgi:hypothetical protein
MPFRIVNTRRGGGAATRNQTPEVLPVSAMRHEPEVASTGNSRPVPVVSDVSDSGPSMAQPTPLPKIILPDCSHSISRSARSRTACGTMMRGALAVLRLMVCDRQLRLQLQ